MSIIINKSYVKLLETAVELNLPLSYKNDLLVHDKELCNGYDQFAWMIYSSGTHFIARVDDGATLWNQWLHETGDEELNYSSIFHIENFYYWDGDDLISFETEASLKQFLKRSLVTSQ